MLLPPQHYSRFYLGLFSNTIVYPRDVTVAKCREKLWKLFKYREIVPGKTGRRMWSILLRRRVQLDQVYTRG